MPSVDLRERTKSFAKRTIQVVASLPRSSVGDVIGKQLLKSGTSIGANYREAQRASSKRHFVTTLEISLREADETLYWLELLAESDVISSQRLGPLTKECNELVAILAASIRTAKQRS
jgi:four helix bundle protein